jgi:anti-anti-sigma factor
VSPDAGPSDRASVELHEISGHTTILALIGEHDLSTRSSLVEQFRKARMAAIVIVDLTPCTFVDSAIIGVLIGLRSRPAQRVEFVLPPIGSHVHRALQLGELPRSCATHATLERALANVQPASANL